MNNLIQENFEQEDVAVIPEVSGGDFSSLPFYHLVFTGSHDVGRTVKGAAAKNLTPVTLELGGKSPTIIADDFDVELAARRVLFAKFMNAGQTCVAPDYVFVPKVKLQEFIALAQEIVQERYESAESDQYTSIIDKVAYARVQGYLTESKTAGAQLVNLLPNSKASSRTRKIPPHLVIEPSPESKLMQEEIFGPILPVLTYENLDEVKAFINARPRPLGLYIFSNKSAVQEDIVNNTRSGGVSINDCSFHAAQHDIPFGGIGESGMGQYHGVEGFREFTKYRPIFKQIKHSTLPLLFPPYGKRFDALIKTMLNVKL
jgi:coniferyl-aldehyde dehydrogenase